MSSARNPQCPPSHWWWWGESWHTYNHARRLKFGTQAGNPMSRTIMRSGMTHVLHVFYQEPWMSSNSLMMMGWFLTHPIIIESRYKAEIWHKCLDSHLKCQGWLTSFMSPVRNPQSSQVADDNGRFLNTLLIMLETQNLAHMFGGTCDHRLLGHWAKDPPKKPSAGARMKGA